jgi:hypothetical protein
MIAFTCPKCGERPVEVICVAGLDCDESKEFWFNPRRGRACDLQRGEFRCERCAVAFGAIAWRSTLSHSSRVATGYEHPAELVGLRRWEPKS